MSIIRKTAIAGLASLTLVAGVAGSTAPAAAWYRGGGWGGPVAAGVIGGLAAGAIIGSAARPYPAYGYGSGYYGYAPEPVYNPCYRSRRPVYDAYGEFAGYRVVRICN